MHSAIANKCVAAMLEKRLIQQLEPYDNVVAEVDIAAQGKRYQTAVKVQVCITFCCLRLVALRPQEPTLSTPNFAW